MNLSHLLSDLIYFDNDDVLFLYAYIGCKIVILTLNSFHHFGGLNHSYSILRIAINSILNNPFGFIMCTIYLIFFFCLLSIFFLRQYSIRNTVDNALGYLYCKNILHEIRYISSRIIIHVVNSR